MDNSKVMIIPVTLKGPNYLLWSRTTKIALCGRGLWNHIELVAEEEEDDSSDDEEELAAAKLAKEAKWFQEDQTVLAIIQNSLEAPLLEAYSFCETANELWETLKNVYGNISNLSRVFEVKKAINELNQEDLEFTRHLGKYRALWAELEMLRPNTMDVVVLNERKEQDKVFGLLLTLNPVFNDLIKHILRAENLPSLDEVCAQVQREQGSLGMFGGKGELPTANKGVFKFEDRRSKVCEHCKKKGHSKDKCWFLHPHLRPSNGPREPRANITQAGPSRQEEELASGDYVRKSDLEALIKSIASLKDSGNKFLTPTPFSYLTHKPTSKSSLIVDSGASHHMISNESLLSNIEPASGNVEIANGDRIPIKGIGNLKLFDKESKALYMPKFTSNLLSVKRTTNDLNCYAIFGPNEVYFQDIKSGIVIGEGGSKDELYVLENLSPTTSQHHFNFSSCLDVSNNLWHARLGHPHSRALKLMLPSVSFESNNCEACILGKHCKTVFPTSTTIYENCFDLVHSDVWTSPCISRDNNKYFVTFIDEKSKYTWITLLPSKDRVFDAFMNFQNYVVNQYNAKIKVFRTDNGGEYTSNKFKEHLAKHGILHQTSCPYTPQQNGVAERKNRHLMEVARSMMFHTNVPKRLWGDAVMTACYLINRIPTKVLEDISPFQVLNKTKPSLEHLKVFGCVCFVMLPRDIRNKLEPKSVKSMFLGYSTTQKGYKCFDPTNNRLYVSREVKFFEEQGYYEKKDWNDLKDLAASTDRASSLRMLLEHLADSNNNNNQAKAKPDQAPNVSISEEEELDIGQGEPSMAENEVTQELEIEEPAATQETTIEVQAPILRRSSRLQTTCPTPSEVPRQEISQEPIQEPPIQEPSQQPSQPVLRRSEREKSDPSTWKEKRVYYNCEAVAHPTQAVCSLAFIPSEHQAFLVKIDQDMIPKSYEEAMENEEWTEAVDDEIGAMMKNETWYETDLPKGKKAVSSKWVFTIKHLSNGDIERYKARLVARGFTQTYGENYTDTFAPVAKLHTVRVVLSIATNLSWDLWQMDVKNAFLQGELEEEVYMTPPPGLEKTVTPGKVLRLKKAIYGLKQSPRAWYRKLSMTLMERGFARSESDHTLFTLHGSKGLVVVLVYVDDLIITGDNKEGIQDTKAYLNSVFDIKDLGELKYFLGIEVCRFSDGLFISQRKYVLDLLGETEMMEAKPAKTPLEEGYKTSRIGEKEDELFEDASKYRRLVGKLIYLTLTRPDLCFAVNQVSQHMKAPTIYHWNMIERILRYLKGSFGQGIWMGKNNHTDLVGYCDADWAGDRNDRKSTTGYCTFIGGNLVTWKTKKQKIVSDSSAEAEYRAMKKLTNELVWLKGLLECLGFKNDEPITMHCDNQAAIHIASNSVFHERTKHIELDCHKVRQKVEQGVILPCFTRSEDQLADIFTKAASLKVCNHIFSKLGLVDLNKP